MWFCLFFRSQNYKRTTSLHGQPPLPSRERVGERGSPKAKPPSKNETQHMTDIQRIAQNTQVTLHFTLKLPNGDVVDTTTSKAPATFTVGDGSLLHGCEQGLFGLEAGHQRPVDSQTGRGRDAGSEQNIQT